MTVPGVIPSIFKINSQIEFSDDWIFAWNYKNLTLWLIHSARRFVHPIFLWLLSQALIQSQIKDLISLTFESFLCQNQIHVYFKKISTWFLHYGFALFRRTLLIQAFVIRFLVQLQKARKINSLRQTAFCHKHRITAVKVTHYQQPLLGVYFYRAEWKEWKYTGLVLAIKNTLLEWTH